MSQSNVRSGFRHEQSDIEFHAAERQFVFHRIIKNKMSLEGLIIKYVSGDKLGAVPPNDNNILWGKESLVSPNWLRMRYHTETAEVTEGHLEEKEVQCLFNLLPSWTPRVPRPLPVISFFAQKPLEGTWPWRWWKIKDKWRERKKANIHFSKSCSALKTILGIFWRILQIGSVISEHLLWCFCYILSLIYIFVIDIFLSFYCKIVKKSKTKTCLFVDPSESGKIRGS